MFSSPVYCSGRCPACEIGYLIFVDNHAHSKATYQERYNEEQMYYQVNVNESMGA